MRAVSDCGARRVSKVQRVGPAAAPRRPPPQWRDDPVSRAPEAPLSSVRAVVGPTPGRGGATPLGRTTSEAPRRVTVGGSCSRRARSLPIISSSCRRRATNAARACVAVSATGRGTGIASVSRASRGAQELILPRDRTESCADKAHQAAANREKILVQTQFDVIFHLTQKTRLSRTRCTWFAEGLFEASAGRQGCSPRQRECRRASPLPRVPWGIVVGRKRRCYKEE